MNLVKKFKLLTLLVAASLFSGADCAVNKAQSLNILGKNDQEFVVFKSNGGKYSWLQFCSPAYNQCNMMLCSPKLENLQPLRLFEKWADGGTGLQRDRKFEGYREPYGAQALEQLFNALGLLSDLQYKGVVLIDEYVQAIPQKWVIRYQDIKPLMSYLIDKMPAPLAVKPLLLLELQGKDSGEFDADAQAFFNTYYTMLDEHDPIVVKFFEKANETLADLEERTKDAKIIMDSMGDAFLRDIEKQTKELDIKKLTVYAAGIVTAALVTHYVTKWLAKPFNEHVLGKKDKPDSQMEELLNMLSTVHNIPRAKPK